ncbi:phosphatidate phosphatase PAH1-like isoform X3 [Nicotiana tomentosiformis]|uniref:phosphatidate phosphatase PAH1-like isoform X3 n=1 Tax=Nicotiana tomentosiformis TaxID=4098 RepID=UPI000878E7AF
MNVVGKVSSFITQGVYSVATPFHPFGGAVDIIVVKQQDGTFRSTPWHVRFGKFQGVLKGAEKVVRIEVNGVEAGFHMYLDNSGEAYFIREVTADNESETNGDSKESGSQKGDNVNNKDIIKDGALSTHDNSDSNEADLPSRDEGVTLGNELAEFGSRRYENLDNVEEVLESHDSSSEVVMVSVDGHILTAPISSSERNVEDVKLDTPRFNLGPGQGTDLFDGNSEFITGEATWADDYSSDQETPNDAPADACSVKNESNTVEHQLNVSEVDGQFRVNLDVKNQENGHVEVTSCGNKKDKVSPVKIPEGVDDLLNPSTDRPCSSPSPDLKLQCNTLQKCESEIDCNGSDGSIDHRAVSDKHLEEQNDVSLAAEKIKSDQQEPDECSQCENVKRLIEAFLKVIATGVEISLCGNLLYAGMGSSAAREAFDANRISEDEFRSSSASIIKNENLVVRIRGNYFSWDRATPIILGMAECDMELPAECDDVIPVEREETSKSGEDDSGITSVASGRQWTLWPNPFRRVKTLEDSNYNSSNEEVFVDSESSPMYQSIEQTNITQGGKQSPQEQFVRTNIPTSGQITSLNLKEGQNMVTFIFLTRVLGEQKVESHLYLWKWNAQIVISDVDGTITKSDVLGQFMPLVGKDWTHFGTARLFSAIKDGKTLPNGPVVISPDGLFPSLYREVIRRAPHEFKIACLEDIKALFPQDYNPFYAGFGNRDTDEFSYRKIGIPKGKIFIINPKGEVSINHQIDVKSYTSLHSLVDDMFPPTSKVEQEDFNAWNFWKMPLSDINYL